MAPPLPVAFKDLRNGSYALPLAGIRKVDDRNHLRRPGRRNVAFFRKKLSVKPRNPSYRASSANTEEGSSVPQHVPGVLQQFTHQWKFSALSHLTILLPKTHGDCDAAHGMTFV